MALTSNLKRALKLWQQTLGASHVITDLARLNHAQTTTFGTNQRVCAILEPKNESEIKRCLKIAGQYQIPVYPVSTGKNWGNGSAVPVKTDSALLTLHRLNAIKDFDPQLGLVTIEPGTTQGQLAEFLLAQGQQFFFGLTGASADTSVVGNILERGDGKGLFAERADQVRGLRVVLPSGDVLTTGIGRLQQQLGPSLNGLFFQSSLGVISQITLVLEPKPELVHSVIFGVGNEHQLAATVDVLRSLSMRRLIPNLSIWNDLKAIARIGQYPFKETAGKTPLPDKLRIELREKYGLSLWNGNCTVFSCSPLHAEAQLDLVVNGLRKFVDWIHVLAPNTSPTEVGNLSSVYWRKSIPIPKNMDPDRDKCGLIWCMPAVPFIGKDVVLAAQICEEASWEHGFEPNLAFIGTHGPTLRGAVAVLYDREKVAEDKKAMALHDAMLKKLAAKTYYPYRLGIQSMDWMSSVDKTTAKVLRQIKKNTDPKTILSPGRYCR